MRNQIKIALIGFGRIGVRHAEEIHKNPDTLCVDIWDTDKQKIPNTYKTYSDVNDFLQNTEAEVIHICTPNADHHPLAISALNAGKHIVIEKPIALKTVQAKEISDLAALKSKYVFCVMQNRFSSVSQWLKALIQSQRLGAIYSVNVKCAWNRDDRYYTKDSWHGKLESDGGPLFTQFSHFVDLLFWLFGNIQISYQEFYNHNHLHNTEFEDSGVFHFHNPIVKQGLFQYTTSVFDKNFKSSIEIIAEKGTVEVAGQYMNEVVYCNIENYTMPPLDPVSQPNQYHGYQGSASNHHWVIQNVVDTLNGKATPHTPISEGIGVVEIIEQVYCKRNLNFFNKVLGDK